MPGPSQNSQHALAAPNIHPLSSVPHVISPMRYDTHTSLDSTMNTEKARSVGANAVLTKFSSVDLSQALLYAFRQMSGQH